MAMRVGILPHADLPHIRPCFRIARELIKWGHDVRLLGSDVHIVEKKHSEAWAAELARFGLSGRQILHTDTQVSFIEYLLAQLRELKLDLLILDAVWQGLAFQCHGAGLAKSIVVHYSGLPEFRHNDMPSWRFVHPGHSRQRWAEARHSMAQAASPLRDTIAAIERKPGEVRTAPHSSFDVGCVEFARLPAIRAMSLCPAHEFPEERGRVEYFGTLLPTSDDADWTPPPAELADPSRPLIACVFGTTALVTKQDYEWLLATAKRLGNTFPDWLVAAVIPQQMTCDATDRPPNLLLSSWIPLWEVLSTREGPRVLVAPPGVGTLREASASATPVVAIPRVLDQFGAAARVAYFQLGVAAVSTELPPPAMVVQAVAHVLENQEIQVQVQRFRDEVRAFDATLPLKRFIDNLSRGEKPPVISTQ